MLNQSRNHQFVSDLIPTHSHSPAFSRYIFVIHLRLYSLYNILFGVVITCASVREIPMTRNMNNIQHMRNMTKADPGSGGMQSWRSMGPPYAFSFERT